MYYKIKAHSMFSAAHRVSSLPNSPCHRLHGHNFKLTVTIGADHLTDGFVCDFYVLKNMIDQYVTSVLDHQYLNELNIFKDIDPTCENIAQWIYQTLKINLNQHGIILKEISLAENELFEVILTEHDKK